MLALAVGIVIAFGPSDEGADTPLDPENAGPEGGQAVARVLADEGVDVSVVRSAERLAAEETGTGTTVVVTSAEQLGSSTVEQLLEETDGASVVVVDLPGYLLEDVGVPGFPGYADTGDALPADGHRGARDALDERPHSASASADIPATPMPVVHASEEAA